MNPAAILSILVETQGTGAASAELRTLDKNARTASGGLDTAQSSATKSGKAMSTFAPIARTAGLVLGGALALGAKAGFGELKDGQKVAEQTNAVLKSTGGVAKVSADQVSTLATAISKKSGIDDEAIQSAENLLLTFTKVRNETGKGNDVFNQATQTIADMSAALGQDLKSSSIQVGKALNDPLKGITALQRVGVSFTKGQKDQIKTLVESGRTMDAQKLILKELNTEFGGSATAAGKTFQGQMNKLQNSFEDVAASLVTMLLPALQTLAGVMANAVEYFQKHTTQAKILGGVLAALAIAMVSVSVATKAIAAASAIATAAQWALNVAMSANPIALIVIALAALAAGLVVAYQKIGPFHDAVDAVFGALKDAFGWAKDNWPLLLAILTGPIGLAVYAIAKHIDSIVAFFKALPGRIVDAIKAGADAIVGVGKWVVNRVIEGVTAMASAVAGAAGWIKNRVVDGLHSAADGFVAVGSWVLNRVVDGIRVVTDLLASVGGWIRNRISEFIHAEVDGLIAIGSWVLNRVVDGFKTVTDALTSIGGWLKNRLTDGIHALAEDFRSAGGWILDKILDGLNVAKKIAQAVADLKDKLVAAVKDVFKDAISIPFKIKLPSIDLPFGGSGGGNVGPGKGKLPSAVDGFNDDASKFGLTMTSGYRPGDPGYHGLNRARDYSNGYATPQELAFARYMASSFGSRLKELIHTPLGFGIKNGQEVPLSFWGSAVNADHFDHVHVAMAKGGLVTGKTYAMLAEKPGLQEAVLPLNDQVYAKLGSGIANASTGGGQTVIVEHHYHGPVVQDRDFLAYLRRADQQHAHRNGHSAFGGN